MHSNNVGVSGEDIAASYLKQNGWKIIERNFECPHTGEIDIIAIDPYRVLVFVEVKASTSLIFNNTSRITPFKIHKVKKCAYRFLSAKRLIIDSIRIDFIGVNLGEHGKFKIEHFELT
jgi:putative endonuclease